MAGRNTKHARTKGYSDIVQMGRKVKNYGTKTGVTVDSEGARQKSGRAPANPDGRNNTHWKDSAVERKIKKEAGRG
jgi:hypothetical protein